LGEKEHDCWWYFDLEVAKKEEVGRKNIETESPFQIWPSCCDCQFLLMNIIAAEKSI
jgi:hypothetical protein